MMVSFHFFLNRLILCIFKILPSLVFICFTINVSSLSEGKIVYLRPLILNVLLQNINLFQNTTENIRIC